MDHVAVKLKQDLVSMDQGNGKEQVRSRIDEPIRSHDDMKWIISLLIVLVHVLHRHWRRWHGYNSSIFVGAINRKWSQPWLGWSTSGDFVSMLESAWEPSISHMLHSDHSIV